MIIDQSIIKDIKKIILDARDKAIRMVDHQRTTMYWHIGKQISEEEQQGKDRADYGSYLTRHVADQLEPQFGSGFSKRQVELFRQLFRTFPIANELRSQLGWTHYKMLIRLENDDQREFYLAEAVKKMSESKQIGKQRIINHRTVIKLNTMQLPSISS
jgi:hypothetical protein